MSKNTAAVSTAARKHSKVQLLNSRRFAKRRDLLGALLDENKRYSVEEAESAIKNFLEGKVN